MAEQMSVGRKKGMVSFMATGIFNDLAKQLAKKQAGAVTVLDTQECCLSRPKLLPKFGWPVHYQINLRSEECGQSYLRFSQKVKPVWVVSLWYLRSDHHEAAEADEIITKLRLPVDKGEEPFATALTTFMRRTSLANEGEQNKIREWQDHAYKWAAQVALTDLKVGLCSHESKQPPTLEADLETRGLDTWIQMSRMYLAPVIEGKVMDSELQSMHGPRD